MAYISICTFICVLQISQVFSDFPFENDYNVIRRRHVIPLSEITGRHFENGGMKARRAAETQEIQYDGIYWPDARVAENADKPSNAIEEDIRFLRFGKNGGVRVEIG